METVRRPMFIKSWIHSLPSINAQGGAQKLFPAAAAKGHVLDPPGPRQNTAVVRQFVEEGAWERKKGSFAMRTTRD
jgi:hypothetical protein